MKFRTLGAIGLALAVAACGKTTPFGDRGAPDEMAISRQAPLVVPPDYSLAPPKPGSPRPIGQDSQQQAVEALFGPGAKPPPKSPGEQGLLDRAGAKGDATARSTAGDPVTQVVDKGAMVKDIMEAPAGAQDASVAQTSTGG